MWEDVAAAEIDLEGSEELKEGAAKEAVKLVWGA